MKIDVSGLQASRTATQGRPDTVASAEPRQTSAGRSDDVTISPRARMLALAGNALQAAPDVRDGVVEAARARLSAGSEAADGRSIARAMIDTISEEAA